MNHDLLAQLLDQHAAALELYARQWCDSPEDVVQEAFLKLAGQRDLPANPAAWLFRVVRNGAIDAGMRRDDESGTRPRPRLDGRPGSRPRRAIGLGSSTRSPPRPSCTLCPSKSERSSSPISGAD